MVKSKSSKGRQRKPPVGKLMTTATRENTRFAQILSGRPASATTPKVLLEQMDSLGIAGNLRLLLDAADRESYLGYGIKWRDVSPSRCEFEFTNSPQFDGTTICLDGKTYLNIVDGNSEWINTLHKADAAFTLLMGIKPVHGRFNLLGTRDGTNGTGVQWRVTSALQHQIIIGNGVSTFQFFPKAGQLALDPDKVNFLAVAIDASGTVILQTNSAQEQRFLGYGSVSNEDASASIKIGARGDISELPPDGTKLAFIGVVDRMLSASELQHIWSSIQTG